MSQVKQHKFLLAESEMPTRWWQQASQPRLQLTSSGYALRAAPCSASSSSAPPPPAPPATLAGCPNDHVC